MGTEGKKRRREKEEEREGKKRREKERTTVGTEGGEEEKGTHAGGYVIDMQGGLRFIANTTQLRGWSSRTRVLL